MEILCDLDVAICDFKIMDPIRLPSSRIKAMTKSLMLPDEAIVSKIHLIRGMKLMLDFDLADMYRTETRILTDTALKIRTNLQFDQLMRRCSAVRRMMPYCGALIS